MRKTSASTTQGTWGRGSNTNYKSSNLTVTNSDFSLSEELNCFFARFDAETLEVAPSHPPAPSNDIFTVQAHEVRHTLRAVNPRKAAGPDGVTGRVRGETALTNWLMSSLIYSTSPCPSA